MKGQLSEADKLRYHRGQHLTQAIFFDTTLTEEKRKELIAERESLNKQIEAMKAKE